MLANNWLLEFGIWLTTLGVVATFVAVLLLAGWVLFEMVTWLLVRRSR